MKKRFFLISVVLILLTTILFSQKRLCVVNDSDGYSNIRESASIKSNIVGTLNDGEFFFIMSPSTAWNKCFRNDYFLGYINESRFLFFDSLTESQKCDKIIEVFNKQIELDSLGNSRINIDSFNSIWDNHTTNSYHPITLAATNFICNTHDLEVFQIYLKSIWENRGSASEEAKNNFAKLGICLNSKMIKLLKENWAVDEIKYFKIMFDKEISNSLYKLKEDEALSLKTEYEKLWK